MAAFKLKAEKAEAKDQLGLLPEERSADLAAEEKEEEAAAAARELATLEEEEQRAASKVAAFKRRTEKAEAAEKLEQETEEEEEAEEAEEEAEQAEEATEEAEAEEEEEGFTQPTDEEPKAKSKVTKPTKEEEESDAREEAREEAAVARLAEKKRVATQTEKLVRKAAAEEEARRKAGTTTNGFAKVLHVEASLRQVAEKEQKAQEATAVTGATEAWLSSDASDASSTHSLGPWGGGKRLSRKEDPLRKGDKTQKRKVEVIKEIWEATPDCVAFASLEPDKQSWCDDNCNAGFCPVDTCACDVKGSAKKKLDVARGSGSEKDGVKVERVKVDMESKGDKNFPFERAIIGYWGAGPHTPFEGGDGPSVADAIKEGYNVITVSFADTFSVDGNFELHTDMCPSNADHKVQKHHHICALPKANISKEAGVPEKSWRYILSFGGAAGPGPYMPPAENLRRRVIQEDVFTEGFVKTYHKMKKMYGFDGIDIDVESSLTTPLLSSFRKIFKILHTEVSSR